MNAKATIISVISCLCVSTIGSFQVSKSPVFSDLHLSKTGDNPILVELQERGSGRRESTPKPINAST